MRSPITESAISPVIVKVREPETVQKLGYSYAEARVASSLSRRSLELLVQKGVLQSLKVGKRVIIKARSLEELLEVK